MRIYLYKCGHVCVYASFRRAVHTTTESRSARISWGGCTAVTQPRTLTLYVGLGSESDNECFVYSVVFLIFWKFE